MIKGTRVCLDIDKGAAQLGVICATIPADGEKEAYYLVLFDSGTKEWWPASLVIEAEDEQKRTRTTNTTGDTE